MTTDLLNRTATASRYAFKASLIGSAHQFELTDRGLNWRVAGKSGVWPYAAISSIRLSYRPVSMQSRRFRADIEARTTWAHRAALDQLANRGADGAAGPRTIVPSLSSCTIGWRPPAARRS